MSDEIPASTIAAAERWERDQCSRDEPHWPHLWARGAEPAHHCVGRAAPAGRHMPPRRFA